MLNPQATHLAQLSNLTSFTGQAAASQTFAAAAADSAYQQASIEALVNYSNTLPAVDSTPHQLGQGTQDPSAAARDTYLRAQESEYVRQQYGVTQDDYKNLMEYKDKVDTYVEMQFLPDDAKVAKPQGGNWLLETFR